MDQFQIKLIINLVIGVVFVIGIVLFMTKRTNWFKPGGVAYEFFKSIKNSKSSDKKSNDK